MMYESSESCKAASSVHIIALVGHVAVLARVTTTGELLEGLAKRVDDVALMQSCIDAR